MSETTLESVAKEAEDMYVNECALVELSSEAPSESCTALKKVSDVRCAAWMECRATVVEDAMAFGRVGET
jgi:hypothetical protein